MFSSKRLNSLAYENGAEIRFWETEDGEVRVRRPFGGCRLDCRCGVLSDFRGSGEQACPDARECPYGIDKWPGHRMNLETFELEEHV